MDGRFLVAFLHLSSTRRYNNYNNNWIPTRSLVLVIGRGSEHLIDPQGKRPREWYPLACVFPFGGFLLAQASGGDEVTRFGGKCMEKKHEGTREMGERVREERKGRRPKMEGLFVPGGCGLYVQYLV